MKVMKLRENEFRDILDVVSQKGIELCYTVEPDGVYIYGSEDVIQEV
jgi:hypothetical protein